MAEKSKNRIITYCRAVSADGTNLYPDLQQALGVCLSHFPNIGDTLVKLREGSAQIQHKDMRQHGQYLHIAAYSEGENVSTVPRTPSIPEADLSSQPPGQDWDYLDGDGMVMASGNHALVLPSGLGQTLLEKYIQGLLGNAIDSGASLPDIVRSVRLLPIENQDVVDTLRGEKIKNIRFNVGQYMETARERDDQKKRTILQNLGRNVLLSLVDKDEDRREIEAAENVNAQLHISFDSRRPGLRHERFSEIIGQPIYETPDDVEFETTTGKRYRRGSLILKKPIRVRSFNKTVNHNDVWEEMTTYYVELRDSMQLEI